MLSSVVAATCGRALDYGSTNMVDTSGVDLDGFCIRMHSPSSYQKAGQGAHGESALSALE